MNEILLKKRPRNLKELVFKGMEQYIWERNYLMELIKQCDRAGKDTTKLYELLINSTDCDFIVKYYNLNDRFYEIRESKFDVVGGTTGLKTWNSSLYLIQFLRSNLDWIKGKKVFEIGSGLGLLGIFCIFYASHVIFSDNNKRVLAELRCNIEKNVTSNNSEIRLFDVERELVEPTEANLLIVSDLLYQPNLHSGLCRIFSLFLQLPGNRILFAFNLRNENTLKKFELNCKQNSLDIKILQQGSLEHIYDNANDVGLQTITEIRKV